MDLLSSSLSSPHTDIILTQLQRMCDSVQKTAQPGSEGAAELAAQSRHLAARRERWPHKIMSVWKNRTVPVFSAEAITKLNQSYLAEDERVNDSRKRHKDALRADINRKKKTLDDIQTKRSHAHDQSELTLGPPWVASSARSWFSVSSL